MSNDGLAHSIFIEYVWAPAKGINMGSNKCIAWLDTSTIVAIVCNFCFYRREGGLLLGRRNAVSDDLASLEGRRARFTVL